MTRTPRLEEFQRPDGYCAHVKKYRYIDEERANEVLKAIRATGKLGKGGKIERRAYRCPWCGMWHLTAKREDDV